MNWWFSASIIEILVSWRQTLQIPELFNPKTQNVNITALYRSKLLSSDSVKSIKLNARYYWRHVDFWFKSIHDLFDFISLSVSLALCLSLPLRSFVHSFFLSFFHLFVLCVLFMHCCCHTTCNCILTVG